MTPAQLALSVFMNLLHLALVAALGVFVLAAVWLVSRAISRRLEDRYLPHVARWSRRRAGLGEDAGPWACPACRSVNPPTGMTCYRCGAPRVEGALELVDVAADDSVFHRPEPRNRFDPSLYRGPGALLEGPLAAPVDAPVAAPVAAPREGHGPGEPAGPVDAPASEASPPPTADPAEPVR